MTKSEAISKIKEIQSLEGSDRAKFPESMKGLFAKQNWHDSVFMLGMEYGQMMALMDVFGVTEKDLK